MSPVMIAYTAYKKIFSTQVFVSIKDLMLTWPVTAAIGT
jgi:hypothetical protein